jgi:hypothetical protein
MFRLAGCGRGAVLARLAPRAPAALHGARAPRPAAGRASLATRASGTDVRFRIPAANIPDDEILTIDDEEIEQRRDNSHATRLVQVCARGALCGAHARRGSPAEARSSAPRGVRARNAAAGPPVARALATPAAAPA